MSKPRVFISSTYYDMRTVRADLERFIREQGYEPVLFERGHIPYGLEGKLEDDCYREISSCDILVNIIGGKFGTQSKDSQYSISQTELKKAIELGKQIYVFVERSILAEYPTYQANKDINGFTPISVSDVRVFTFLEEIFLLFGRNPVEGFETSQDIIAFLREQWAGLFKQLLQETLLHREAKQFEELSSMLSTVQQLVNFLTAERTKDRDAIREILTSSHPIFVHLKNLLRVPYRIYFTNLEEFRAWIAQRSFKELMPEEWDDPEIMEWITRNDDAPKHILKVRRDLFDSTGKLKVITPPNKWDADAIQYHELNQPAVEITDDEIPF